MSISTPVSFEFFPPKTEEGREKLLTTHATLSEQTPEFFSVTYGAGGSTQERTINTVIELNNKGICTAPHISCIGASQEKITELLDLYKANGIKRVVALRGDLPSGMGATNGDFHYASDLVAFIREQYQDQFHIEVAAYPEMHPQAVDFNTDLRNFMTKVNAGASSAITQYFYNPDAYSFFVDQVRRAGSNIDIVPGIMPITNYTNLVRFSDGCGAEIPRWIKRKLEAYRDDVKGLQAFGADVVADLCRHLIDRGAPALHFYSMNQSEPTLNILDRLS
ncbi:methylenetetrahydrofolate reductase [NAD(P)H] [Gynuella sunshinyii]|uniref:Methylenetetrahydrofolate reductase n=1 Tax=Gynuella sunshinyii YC6258 TaxID=1445510 RepID=A0A0C5VQL7_9GAMM|nr:methylenetetrahydrofolate reductase [NAD(P)H] [Gynuella sunshinyii]AJQ92564.1 5,10-methylenetetrahydrofolate reductase [Gynuella sunshinyii YC6258]